MSFATDRRHFERFALRARRLVDVSGVDMSVDLLGERWETPIVLSPVGSQKAFHPEGELAAARASSAMPNRIVLVTKPAASESTTTSAAPRTTRALRADVSRRRNCATRYWWPRARWIAHRAERIRFRRGIGGDG